MRKRLSTKVKTVLVLAVVIAALLAILTSIFGTTWPEKAVQSVLTPIRSGVSAITRQVERYYDYIFGYEALEAKNRYLEQRIAELENQDRDVTTLERENERYRELLNLSEENVDYVFCSAYIVSWDSSSWKSSFSIGKGTNSGLAEGMVAVTENGQVVGLISDIGSNWATITTVLDSSVKISASISSSGYTGVVQGSYTTQESGYLRMEHLPNGAVLRNNDQVVTTGSTVYPKNLILGYIADAGEDDAGVSKYALLEPAVDFDALEQVFIITQFAVE